MALKSDILTKLNRITLHILFWSGILLFFTYIFGVDNTLNRNLFYFALFLMPVTIGITYVSIYKLIPDYLIPKRYALFVLYSAYTIIISIFGIIFSIFFGLAYLTNFEFKHVNTVGRNGIFITTCIYLVVIVASAFKLLQLNLKQSKQNVNLKAKILEAQLKLKEQELDYLKMQIHPHFLFNTLNTIYGLTLKNNIHAPEMILKLSNLLDYVLYQIDKPFVSLNEEIQHIKDYINLEQLRFHDKLEISFTNHQCSENIEIAPMLFLPFVENSFKHGNIIDGKLKTEILFKCTGNTINFMIKNSYIPTDKHTYGIGLENIKKRLSLLYPKQHLLKIETNKNTYTVHLNINLNPNERD